jgi:membrane-bound lytic murein transglycosylase B
VLIEAARDLRALSAGWPPHKVKTGNPRPLAELDRYYDAARRRHGIHQHYLAAIHHVESKFGRVKNDSVAGAQGPMQFIPSTWDIYGHGNVHDPHDAILAAANLLDDNGAPEDYRRALHAYNPSRLYVDAVQRYARLIKHDAYAIYFLYCWGP